MDPLDITLVLTNWVLETKFRVSIDLIDATLVEFLAAEKNGCIILIYVVLVVLQVLHYAIKDSFWTINIGSTRLCCNVNLGHFPNSMFYHRSLDVACCICPYFELVSLTFNVMLTSRNLHSNLHLKLNSHHIYDYAYGHASLFLQPISRNSQCLGPRSHNSNMTSYHIF